MPRVEVGSYSPRHSLPWFGPGAVPASSPGSLLKQEELDAFCLVADSEEIIHRLLRSHARDKRPLLAAPDPERAIRDLLQQREVAYRQFEQIDTTGKSPNQICRILLELYLQN